MKRNVLHRSKVIFFLAVLTSAGSWAAGAASPSGDLDVSKIRTLPVQFNGRWMPMDTLARDVVRSVTGDQTFEGRDPVWLLLAWTFDAETWRGRPLITIGSRQLREILSLPASQRIFSYNELNRHEPLNRLFQELAEHRGDKLDPLESKVSDIRKKLDTLSRAFTGRMILPIPDAGQVLGPWRPIDSSAPAPVTKAWSELQESFRAGDGSRFAAATDTLISALEALPSAYKPGPKILATEVRYNRLHPFRTAWIVMLVGAVLAGAGVAVRRKAFDVLVIIGLICGFAVLTYGLSLRWKIAGHIPASNMFESLLFLSWGMGLFAILSLPITANRLIPLTASVMGAVALILADCLPIDPFIRPIAPVLRDTVWMSIHVPVIMVSYSVLALAVLIAHVQVVSMAAVPGRDAFIRMIDRLHYGYVYAGSFLLLAGIITGSMWAASSWGRYWGWDPKEVWSLVALLGYLAILHVRIDRSRIPGWAYGLAGLLGAALLALMVQKLAPRSGFQILTLAATAAAMALFVVARGPFATALKSILAFWLIIMTYVGVNYVLGTGLHSYAFGTGAVVHYLFLIGGIDLAFVGLFSFIYLSRIRSDPKTETVSSGQ